MIGVLGGKHRSRALFYDNLADTLDAGLPLRQALATVASGASAPGRAARALEERVLAGASLVEAMAADPRTFTAFERHAAEAGEKAGRLPEVLRALSGHFVVRGQALDSLEALVFPAALVHVAIFVRAVVASQLDLGLFLRALVPPLFVLWGAIALGVWAWRLVRASEAGRLRADRLALAIPVVGRVARATALSDYALALGLLHGAGVPMFEALDRAAEVPRNAAFGAAARRVAERVRGGEKLADALAAAPEAFSRLFVECVRIGETTGMLDEQLDRAARAARDDSARAIKAAAVALPIVLYVAVGAYVAWFVISFWTNYYGELLKGF